MPASAAQPHETTILRGTIMRLARLRLGDPMAEAIAILLFVPLTLSVALWNGFPIIFYDTGAYLLEGLGRVFMAERSPVYSLFLDYDGARVSLWLIALTQALAMAFIVVETARAVAPNLRLVTLLAVGIGLVLLTGLPWYVGQIEPDCFAGIAVLSIYLLAFQHRTLAGWRIWLVFAIGCLAAAVHLSHLLLAAGLLVVVGLYRLTEFAIELWRHASPPARKGLSIRSIRHYDWPRAYLLRAALACAIGLGLIVASNYKLAGKVFISRAGPAFLFARMLQDHIVMRLLDDTCPRSHYRLCAFKNVLPRTADQWLWGRDSPFLKLGRFMGTNAESTRIIWDSIKRYPGLEAEWAFKDSARQFVMFKTGDQIEPQEWVLSRPLKQFIPGQLPAYLAARQQQGAIDFRPINIVHLTVAWLSLVGLIGGFVVAAWRHNRKGAVFLGFVLVALIGNAVICGALSNPHDRYQSRLIWLAPFALALIVGDWRTSALRGVRESGS